MAEVASHACGNRSHVQLGQSLPLLPCQLKEQVGCVSQPRDHKTRLDRKQKSCVDQGPVKQMLLSAEHLRTTCVWCVPPARATLPNALPVSAGLPLADLYAYFVPVVPFESIISGAQAPLGMWLDSSIWSPESGPNKYRTSRARTGTVVRRFPHALTFRNEITWCSQLGWVLGMANKPTSQVHVHGP